jgi:hypothetical protein
VVLTFLAGAVPRESDDITRGKGVMEQPSELDYESIKTPGTDYRLDLAEFLNGCLCLLHEAAR